MHRGPATRVWFPRDRGELGHLGLWRTACGTPFTDTDRPKPGGTRSPLRISADRRRAGDNQTTTRGDDGRPGREQTCGHHRRTATRGNHETPGLCPSFVGVDNGSVGGDNGSRLRVFPARGVGRAFAVLGDDRVGLIPRRRHDRAVGAAQAPEQPAPATETTKAREDARDPCPAVAAVAEQPGRAARTSIPAATTITEQEPAPTAVTCRRAHTRAGVVAEAITDQQPRIRIGRRAIPDEEADEIRNHGRAGRCY